MEVVERAAVGIATNGLAIRVEDAQQVAEPSRFINDEDRLVPSRAGRLCVTGLVRVSLVDLPSFAIHSPDSLALTRRRRGLLLSFEEGSGLLELGLGRAGGPVFCRYPSFLAGAS